MRHQPWSFEDGPALAERIRREYAARLLESLPFLQDGAQRSSDLVEGYRQLWQSVVTATRRFQRIENPRLITTRANLQREARTARAVWEVVHCHLVACGLCELQGKYGHLDDLDLVLLAEQLVEGLVGDIE